MVPYLVQKNKMNKVVEFSDILYGTIQLPDWIIPFIKLPEFLRLRGVRLSNVDSYQHKDFSGPTRWEHGIGVSFLALRYSKAHKLGTRDEVHLMLGGLLHDVATPPFGHTAEYALEAFDHELESRFLLGAIPGKNFSPEFPVYCSQLPRFHKACKSLSTLVGFKVDPEEIAKMVIGEGKYGFLVRGTIDLDNADNVVRACMYLGIDVDRNLPIKLVEWLSSQYCPPTDIDSIVEEPVLTWQKYRHELYRRFYQSSDEELGRQAFLQHIMRKAIAVDFPRKSLIWNTDEGFLNELSRFLNDREDDESQNLRRLLQRYRLLDAPVKIAEVDIEDSEDFRVLSLPQAVAWIDSEISGRGIETSVMISARRDMGLDERPTLFPPPEGSLQVFKLGGDIKREQLPEWILEKLPEHYKGSRLYNSISRAIDLQAKIWISEKPWLRLTANRKSNILSNLDHIGDWGFRLSQNENLHAYPATFVYAIPASLLIALGLKGELVIDPFGGTGQTAIEVIKNGGKAITADCNTVACMVAEARTTFMLKENRSFLRMVSCADLMDYEPSVPPNLENIHKWFNPKTLEELCRIWTFTESHTNNVTRNFLRVCFSAILYSCTARRGKEHGYFADNTPLARGEVGPPYQNAVDLFITRLQQSLNLIEQSYAFIERTGRDPESELKRAKVLKLDAASADAADYGIDTSSASGIITSPPYLCMADYSLGQRLSYAWIAPDELSTDFKKELGARRKRFRPKEALGEYLKGLKKFVSTLPTLLRHGGFLATVLGEPVAKAFEKEEILKSYDSFLEEVGFELVWHRWRDIHWHRNHGYARLKKERVSVHLLH